MSRSFLFGLGRTLFAFVLVANLVGFIPFGLRSADAQSGFPWSISRQSGPPGSKVTVKVNKAPPDTTITVEGDGKTLCKIKTDGDGEGSCTFRAPKKKGNVKIKLTEGGITSSETDTFKITNENENSGHGGGKGNRGGETRGDDQGRFDNSRSQVNLPSVESTAGCGLSVIKTGIATKISKGMAAGEIPGSLLSCRDFVPGYTPPSPEVLNAIENVGCASDALGILAALAPSPPTIAYGLVSAAGTGMCVAKKLDDAGRMWLKEQGWREPVPLEELGPLPNVPIDLDSQPQTSTSIQGLAPAVPLLPLPPIAPDVPSFQDVLDGVQTQVSEPSAQMVHERHEAIMGDLCDQLPAGARGCP